MRYIWVFCWIALLSSLTSCSESPVQPQAEVAAAKVAEAGTGGRPFSLALEPEFDPNGSGTALLTLNPGQEEACWHVTVENIALPATASHVHKAPPGFAGPPIFSLNPPDASGVSTGCTTVDRKDLLAILQDPGAYYLNVHTTEFPAGAVRAQLAR